MKARRLDRAVQLQELSALRKKNVGEYFVNFTRHHRSWLHELAQKYKERGEFPLMGMVLLPSYYDGLRDKEIAVFAGLLIPDGGTVGHTTLERVGEFREMLGESPWEWFVQRKFVSLSIGKNLHKRTGCVENWKIAKLFDFLWQECHVTTAKTPLGDEVTFIRPLSIQVDMIAKAQRCSYFDVLTYLLENCSIGNYFYKLRLLLIVLCSGDGFGLSLWQNHNAQDTLRCPLTTEIRQFVETWFPDYRRYGSVDDAIRLFGFERDCDFFYAWLGYRELQKRNPWGCRLYATKYTDWYVGGIRKKPHQWREVMPGIEF